MHIPHHPFQIIDWSSIEAEKHEGESGFATWQLLHSGTIRIRKVEYSNGYKADHWCNKGHIIYCVEGSMVTELADGRMMPLSAGMTYIVGDDNEAHRTSSEQGCILFIVD